MIKLSLSPHSLILFLECPRCFWLQFNKGIRRPERIVPGVPRGIDYVLKRYFDRWREKGMVPELEKLIKGAKLLKNQELVDQMRKTSFGVPVDKDVFFRGALDDALELDDGAIVPLDNKSKGFPPKEVHWSYKLQLSSYNFILKERGIKTKRIGYLIYWFLDPKKLTIIIDHLIGELKLKRFKLNRKKLEDWY